MQSLCVANFVTLTWFQLKLKQMFASMKMRPPYFFIYDHLHWAFWGNIQILLGLATSLTAQVLNFQKARQAKRAFWVLFKKFRVPRFHMNSARLAIFFKTLYSDQQPKCVLLKKIRRGAEQNVNTDTAPKYVHQPFIISWGSSSSIFQINFNQQQSTLISCMMLMLSTNICNWEIEASYVAHLSFMSILQSIPESKFQINSNWIYFCWCEQGQHIVVNFP